MKQSQLFDPIPLKKLQTLSKEQLIAFHEAQQKIIEDILRDNARLRDEATAARQSALWVQDKYVLLKKELFGKSSEREPIPADEPQFQDNERKAKRTKIQLPSQRYPNADLLIQDIELRDMPKCRACEAEMEDSGLTEDAEYLTVEPRQFTVVRQRRHKYRCGKCHGDMQTAPALPRITPGSSYSDDMAIDVAAAKYCDLVPIERYATIAGREGLKDLPPQSLIELTHNLAEFVKPAADRILEQEIKTSLCLHADETPHRMLEGSPKSNWYLWGFSTKTASHFEIHDTRSGDVASGLLKDSRCQYLVSDVFSGYAKAVRETNEERRLKSQIEIKNAYCNAHARRKFKEARERFTEAQFYLDQYRKIYRLEAEVRDRPPDDGVEIRRQMETIFSETKSRAIDEFPAYSSKSAMAKALGYFLENYAGLTLFLGNLSLPIDNNPQERLLRNPVIGRKIWYGTHSERGARTTAIMFTLIESCKLNAINPRLYLKKLVEDLHQRKQPYTPWEFKNLNETHGQSAG